MIQNLSEIKTNMIFTEEERMIHRLILESSFLADLGLLHGKMGIAIFFMNMQNELATLYLANVQTTC